jgi:hypothetical protein
LNKKLKSYTLVEKLIGLLLGFNMSKFKVSLKQTLPKLASFGGATPTPQQKKAGNEVLRGFENGKVFQLIIAETQSGKTGTMVYIGSEYAKRYGGNVVVLTGLSSVDWKKQTKLRCPDSFSVYHRNDLKKLSLDLENTLLLIDEVQIACKTNMSIDVLLQNAGAKDFDFLEKNNVRVAMVSATPNKVYDDIKQWNEDKCGVVVQQNGAGYTGLGTLLESGRIFDCEDLWVTGYSATEGLEKNSVIDDCIELSLKKIKKLIDFVNERYSNKYHIIRTPYSNAGEELRGRFMNVGGDHFDYYQCDNSTDHDIMDIIKNVPVKNTFLFIKEQLRCAITLKHKENLGVLYDRKSQYGHAMVQGLAGRATGYNVPEHIVVFTFVKSIERYAESARRGFVDISDKVSYLRSTETFVNVDGWGGVSPSHDDCMGGLSEGGGVSPSHDDDGESTDNSDVESVGLPKVSLK